MVLVASKQKSQQNTSEPTTCPIERFNLMGITLIDSSAQYKYIDMGQDTFMTVVIPKQS